MANSRYEYVRSFEQSDNLLPNTWIVVRVDGRGFHRLSQKYNFRKPNDKRALDLMNEAAIGVMKELPDLILAYGVSDEYSFVFHKECMLFERRSNKLTSTIVSTFSSYYTHLWPMYFPNTPLSPPLPSFDGRAVVYPSDHNLRDYVSWRQVDCHINNLYNTTFWALVQHGKITPQEAERELMGTLSADKNEILFSRFGINYNNELDMFKKGSVLFRNYTVAEGTGEQTSSEKTREIIGSAASNTKSQAEFSTPSTTSNSAEPYTAEQQQQQSLPSTSMSKTAIARDRKKRVKAAIELKHIDVIKDDFWVKRPWILSGRTS